MIAVQKHPFVLNYDYLKAMEIHSNQFEIAHLLSSLPIVQKMSNFSVNAAADDDNSRLHS